jgi:hypothetical protein
MCISHVIKKRDTCHFYRLDLRRFLQPSLEENSVPFIIRRMIIRVEEKQRNLEDLAMIFLNSKS